MLASPSVCSSELWLAWLCPDEIVERFETKCYVRSPAQCWPWLNAVSSTGHTSFHAVSLHRPSRRGTAPVCTDG